MSEWIDKWESIIAFAVSIGTLIVLLTGGGEYIILIIDSWLHRDPAIVIRSQKVREFDEKTEYLINFSIVNRRDESITLNSVVLHIGDYSFGSTILGEFWIAFKKFSKEIYLCFVGHPNGTSFPMLKEYKSENSMGSSIFTMISDRGSINPNEQIDVNLKVNLYLPPKLKGKYKTVWSLGGQIELRYEDHSLKERTVLYPASRNQIL